MLPFKIISNITARIGTELAVYIDPCDIDADYNDADAVLFTKSWTGVMTQDILRVANDATMYFAPFADGACDYARMLSPDDVITVTIRNIELKIQALPVYRGEQQLSGQLGYLIEMSGYRFFYSGESSLLPLYRELKADFGFFTFGGDGMSLDEAVNCAIDMKLYTAVPIRCDSISNACHFNYLYVNGRLGELKETFRQMGLPDEVYVETVTDIDAKRGECRSKLGVDGLPDAYNWYGKFLKGHIRRYGRLEYEILPRAEVERRFPAVLPSMGDEQWIVNVHIPSNGGSLTKENIEESFARAYDAFVTNEHYFSDGKMRLACRSWLLDDTLRGFLKESSGIITLQNEFDIIEFRDNPNFDERNYIWGGQCREPIETWSEDNSLQRGMKQFLMRGGIPREGLGVRSFRR